MGNTYQGTLPKTRKAAQPSAEKIVRQNLKTEHEVALIDRTKAEAAYLREKTSLLVALRLVVDKFSDACLAELQKRQ